MYFLQRRSIINTLLPPKYRELSPTRAAGIHARFPRVYASAAIDGDKKAARGCRFRADGRGSRTIERRKADEKETRERDPFTGKMAEKLASFSFISRGHRAIDPSGLSRAFRLSLSAPECVRGVGNNCYRSRLFSEFFSFGGILKWRIHLGERLIASIAMRDSYEPMG